jgi:two-component system, chemotaxis family, chemotaxis protein CheY
MLGDGLDFSSLRVLVVENHLLMRRIIREMLRGFGVRDIREARDVPGALDLMGGQSLNFVILDFFLGEMDGADFTRAVRRNARCPNREVPILLVTAQPDHHQVVKARDAGIDSMLAKPIAPKELYSRMARLLTAKRRFIVRRAYAGPIRRKVRLLGAHAS